uniref:Fatty acid synthase n=1 Tax=Ditylenchus dipsaci TaxID=166011 RepID=A0A915CXH4_9BILA
MSPQKELDQWNEQGIMNGGCEESLLDMLNTVVTSPQTCNRTVLQSGNSSWTLMQLNLLADKLAKLLVRRFKCEKGGCVAIYMNKQPEYVFSYVAALKCGAAYLPLDISYPESLLNNVINEVTPAVICTTSEHAKRLPADAPVFVFDAEGLWMQHSGTTGKPKGIACPHRGAVISYKYRFQQYPYQPDDVVACNVFFVWELFRPILQGIKMVIVPDDVIYDPKLLCQFLSVNKVTRMLFTPSLLETVLDTQTEQVLKESFKYFRVVHLCGEVVTCALLTRFMTLFPNVQCVNLYSISETHDVAVADLSDFYARKEERQFAPVGKVIDCVKVFILDNLLKKVPIGVPGEIYVAGPTLASGYINRPELNKNRFVDVPREYQQEAFGKRMYRTGDWGYLLPNSVLEICGRCDTLVRIRGYGVELQAIEATLLKLKYVSSCTVISIGAEGEDKQLAAYMVLRENVSRKILRADLKRRLPFYMVPQFFVFIERMPVLAASSKIDKRALPAVDYARDIVEAEALPQTPTEQRLAKIWAQILHHSTLDIQESFFDLGGHSLLAARLLAKVNEEFGVELTMRELFLAPTVYAMACILDGSERSSPEQILDLDYQVDTHDVKDNVMDLHLRAFWRSTEWDNRFFHSNILLTGVTGFLGSHLLVQLLNSSRARVVCLVRELAGETVDQRLESALNKRGLLTKALQAQLKDRVQVVSADIALVQFGLSEEHYHFLSYDIDVVIHAAAYVNLIYPYQALHGINVLGTRNVLDFCLKNKIKPLHYISTDAVIPAGVVNSKYVAEQLVRRSQSRGLPCIIYRLGNQAASSSAGYWNEQDFIYLMLLSVICTRKAPNVDWTMEMTPVDFSAKLIGELTTTCFCRNVGKTFHITNSQQAPKWSQFVDWLNQFGFIIEKISLDSWIDMIRTSEDNCLQQQKIGASYDQG